MRRDEALTIIRAHEAELRAMGVESVELFGSVARDEAGPESDVDVLVQLSNELRQKPWGPIAEIERMEGQLSDWLGTKVDVAMLPLRRTRFGQRVAKERVHVY